MAATPDRDREVYGIEPGPASWIGWPKNRSDEYAQSHRANVEQEAADKFLGLQRYRLFAIAVSSISIAQGDLSVLDLDNTIVGECHAVGVAAEVVEDGLGRAERLLGIDDPALLA